MRSLLWKEIRESLPWAILLGLGWTLALVYAIHFVDQDACYGFICYLLYPELVFITSLGPMLAGTILGLLAILPELSPDRWAYLVHRPVPMRQIYWAKVVGGLALYALALGVPYGVLVAWVAFPGHQAGPFHLLMALPSLMDIVVGANFYLAAIVVGIRPAQWWGTKALPWLAAAFVWNSVQHQMWWDLLLLTAFGGIALLLWAGRGCFIALERPAQRSEFPSLALCAVMCLGLMTLLQGIYNYVGEAAQRHDAVYSYYAVDTQERVLKVLMKGGVREGVLDLGGHPVASPRAPLPWGDEDFVSTRQTLTIEPSSFSGVLTRGSMAAEYFIVGSRCRAGGSQFWYYDFLRKQCLGYDVESKQLVGMVAGGGFVTPDWNNQTPFVQSPESDAQISMLNGSRTLWTVHQEVIGLDFKAHQVHSIAKVGSNKAYVAGYADEERDLLKKCIIAEGNHLAVYDWDAGLLFSKELSMESKGAYELCVYRNPETQHYIVERYPANDGTWPKGASDRYFDMLGAKGELLNHVRVPSILDPDPRPWPTYLSTPLAPPIWYPLHLFHRWCSSQPIWSTNFKDPHSSEDEWDTYRCLYVEHPDQLIYDLGGLLLSSLAAYLLFRRLARRRGWTQDQTRVWRWAMILGGLPAWLAFRMLHKTPATMACPLCHQSRELHAEACPHCHQPWPQPAGDGTEIIAP